MKMKQIVSMVSAAALALSVTATPSVANDDTAKAIAGVIALGVLGAAIADHQHKRGDDEYTPHPKVHADENAVGHCLHRAKRKVEKAGGYRVELEHVSDIKVKNDGSTHVWFTATGYYTAGHKTSDAVCVVKDGKITSFDFT